MSVPPKKELYALYHVIPPPAGLASVLVFFSTNHEVVCVSVEEECRPGETVEGLMGEAERNLFAAETEAADKVAAALATNAHADAIEALAGLRGPVDAVFEDVMVMDEDEALKTNRLRLLNRFVEVFEGVADIGKLAKK